MDFGELLGWLELMSFFFSQFLQLLFSLFQCILLPEHGEVSTAYLHGLNQKTGGRERERERS